MDFYRGWEDYQFGFGNITGEFWLGILYTCILIDGTETVICQIKYVNLCKCINQKILFDLDSILDNCF